MQVPSKTFPTLITCFIWAVIACFASGIALAQSKFIVWKNGKEIGKLETYERQTTYGHWYGLSLEMKAKIITSMEIKVQVINFFDAENNLTEASYSRSMNNGSAKQHSIKITKTGYELVANGKQPQMFAEPVQFSTLQLYFSEPLHVTQIFSENHGRNLPLKCIGKGVYILQQPDGYTTTYWFYNGRLEKVEGESMFGKVQFIRS